MTSFPRLCVQSRAVSAVSRRVLYFPPKITFESKRVLSRIGYETQKANTQAMGLCEGSDGK